MIKFFYCFCCPRKTYCFYKTCPEYNKLVVLDSWVYSKMILIPAHVWFTFQPLGRICLQDQSIENLQFSSVFDNQPHFQGINVYVCLCFYVY